MKARRAKGAQQLLPPPSAKPPEPAPAALGADRGFKTAARGPRQLQLGARVVLWGLVASGPLIGLAAFAEHSAPAHVEAAAAATPDTTGASGVAELFLQAWLSAGQGSEASVRVYYPAYPDQTQPTDQRQAEAIYVISSQTSSVGVVTVQLAAHVVAAASNGGWSDESWHYYQIPMALGSGAGAGYLALALPAEIQAPAQLANEPNNNYSDTGAPTTGTPLSAAVDQFLAAYLTGQGVVSRYTVPNSTLSAISPAPYASVQLEQLATDGSSSQDQAQTVPAAGTVRHVLATVTAIDAAGHDYSLDYPLVLEAVAGQWEVASLAPSPDLAAAPSAALASTGAEQTASPDGSDTSSSPTGIETTTP